LLLHGGRGLHTRRTDAVAAKQKTVAYLSGRGRGNRCLCRRELIIIVTPLRRPGSANTAASVCLCYRKQERSLFTDALGQTSNVPTDRMSADRRAASDGGPVVSHTRHRVGDRVPPSRCTSAFDRCTTAPERPGRCPPFHSPIPPATSTDCPATSDRGRRRFPRPSSGSRWLMRFPGRAPPGRFGQAHCRLC